MANMCKSSNASQTAIASNLDRTTGCTIHGNAPYIWQIFDCQLAYLEHLKVPRDQRRALNRKIPGRAEAMKNARILDSYPLFMD